jgi:predicted nucleic acid-binding protein
MKLAIDTNVPIAANGRDTHAEAACQLRCVELLERIANGQCGAVVMLDSGGLVLNEYTSYLNYRGQPGVGDLFFKFLHDHMYVVGKVQLVQISPTEDTSRGFEELPVNRLDPSDRKFLAVAVVSGADVVNALDTDWHEQRALLTELGLTVQQLCPEYGCAA